MNCANCNAKALYEYTITQGTSVFYCGKHLPKFLEGRKIASLIPLTNAHNEELTSALDILSVKADETPAEEPAPKVVKKAAKKQAN